MHLRSWLLKKSRMQLKHGFLLSFTSLCNFIIVSSINSERILILASAGSPPLLLSQLSQSPVRAFQHPTNHRRSEEEERGRQSWRWKDASKAHATRGHTTGQWPMSPCSCDDLRCINMPSEEKHTQIIQNKAAAEITWSQHVTLTHNQPDHTRSWLPSRLEVARSVMCNLLPIHRTISLPLWKLCRSLFWYKPFLPHYLSQTLQTTSLAPKTCRSEPKSSAMLLWIPFSFSNR